MLILPASQSIEKADDVAPYAFEFITRDTAFNAYAVFPQAGKAVAEGLFAIAQLAVYP